MNMRKTYTQDFIAQVVDHYVSDPTISQAALANYYDVPVGTVVSWLRCKSRGLTPFQRFKRNRDNLIRRRWDAANQRIEKIRRRRNNIGLQYGLTNGTIKNLVYSKEL